MDSIFAAILDDAHSLVGAERCSLFFVDEERGELWTKVATDRGGEIKVRALLDGPRDAGFGDPYPSHLRRLSDSSASAFGGQLISVV